VGSNSSNINYLWKDLFVNKHEKHKYGDKKNVTLQKIQDSRIVIIETML